MTSWQHYDIPSLDHIEKVRTAAASVAPETPPPSPVKSGARPARAVILTSGGQAMAMATGGLMAILLATRFRGSSATDGFFAAYSVYGLVLLVAQSTRLTVVPRLIGGPARYTEFDRYLCAIGVLWIGLGVVFVALGGPLASLLTGTSAARSTARDAFLVLWPAAGAQLVAALGAAMLGVLGSYGHAAAGYVAGSLASVGAFVALADPLGINSVAVALLIGALVTATPVLWSLLRRRWRPPLRGAADGTERRAALILLGAASVAAPQLLYVIGVAAAASLGSGTQTAFSYGFAGVQVLVSVLAGSVSIVAAAPIAASWDRDPRSLGGSIERGFRLAVLILVPCIAAVALIGSDVAGRLLSGFSSSEVRAVISSFFALSPLILAAQASAIPLVALYALHRHAAVTSLAIGAAALQIVLATGAVAVGGIVTLGVATSISSLAFAAGLYVLLYGCRLAIREGFRRIIDVISVGVPAAACFVAPSILGVGKGLTLVIGLVLLAPLLVSRALRRRDPSAEAARPEGP